MTCLNITAADAGDCESEWLLLQALLSDLYDR